MELLFVDCCISQRGEASRTKTLCNAYLEAYAKAHPQTTITYLDLQALDLQPLDVPYLDKRSGFHAADTWDDPLYDLAHQFKNADAIVVGAPFWDLTFPALLRIYIEHISAVGLTYYYDATGCHGTCKAKSLVYLTTGGDFPTEPSLGIAHWQALCNVFGIAQFDSVFAGGLDIDPTKAPGLVAQACEKAKTLAQR